MAASMKMAVFWVVAPYKFIDVSEVRNCLRNEWLTSLLTEAASTSETSVNFTRLHGATTQKTAIFEVRLVLFALYH
jgi:hypothetical protein